MSLTVDEIQQYLDKSASYGRILGNDIVTEVKMGCFNYSDDTLISNYFTRYILTKKTLS